MSNSLAMTAPAWAVLVMFLMMATSHLVVEPAYYGYLVGFAVFAVLTVRNLFDFSPRGFAASGGLFAWAIFATWVFAVTAFAHPAFRDLFRDMGAVLSFSVGFFLIPRGLGRNWERTLLSAFSVLSMVLSVWVIASAGRAYLSGASAYEWRGAYVPFAHTWLPYLIVAEYLRSRLPQFKPEISAMRIGLCIVALLASLSRTGLAQLAIFLPLIAILNGRRWLLSPRGLLLIVIGISVAVAAFPYVIQLDVVQQRINAGIGDEDLSLAWRHMEVRAAQDYLTEGGWFRWLFGYGLGARVPLPWGIVDFDGNSTIPHLHNSYWTLMVKFGAFGFLWIFVAIGVTFVRAQIVRAGPLIRRTCGGGMLLMVLLTAYTLQGMSEWSHLLFLGLSCALLREAGRKIDGEVARNARAGPITALSRG